VTGVQTCALPISDLTDPVTDAELTYFDIFPILFPTEGSFATIGLKGAGKIKFYSKSPEQIDSGNTYGAKGFFSYKFRYASVILQEEKLLKGLFTASA